MITLSAGCGVTPARAAGTLAAMLERVSLLLVLVLAACGVSAAPDRDTTVADEAASALSAFVVLFAGETIVVPVDPAQPTLSVAGIWLLDPSTQPARVIRAIRTDPRARLPECCPGAADACEPSFLIDVVPPDGPVPSPLAHCRCAVDDEPACDATPDELASPDPCYGVCDASSHEDAPLGPASVVGGVLFEEGEGNEGSSPCDGSIYYARSGARLLAPGAADERASERFVVRGRTYCILESSTAGPTPSPGESVCARAGEEWRPWDFAHDRPLDPEGEENESALCRRCDRGEEASVVRLQSGRLVEYGWRYHGPSFLTLDRVSPQSCPSAADPCGDPTSFAVLRERIDPARPLDLAFYVATDGSAALVGDQGEVWLPEGTHPVRSAGVRLENVLGVRFHADARPLVDAMQRARAADEAAASAGIPALEAHASCASESDCAAGQRCSASMCHAPCTSDGDCATIGVCGGFCGREGSCLLQRERGCNASHACDPGFDCSSSERCEPHDAALVEADRAFVDRRRGRDWGNRCYRHVQAGEHEAAEAACEEGLALANDDTVRAAILYNLGLAAEGRRWTVRAREYYEASLALRDNDAVSDRLDALSADDE